jgi:hypothetical protein
MSYFLLTNKNKTFIYLNTLTKGMNKALLIFLVLVAIPSIYASTTYQETANSTNYTANYIYENYTKPYLATMAIWQVKHSNLSAYNITINTNNPCWTQSDTTLQLRLYSSMVSAPAKNYTSQVECYNGTAWQQIGTISNCYGNGDSAGECGSATGTHLSAGAPTRVYDGNWSSQNYYWTNGATWYQSFTSSDWQVQILYLYEDGIYWTDGGCVGADYTFKCGQTINQSCTLNTNIQTNDTCFTIGATNIIIDGAGYTISNGSAINNSAYAFYNYNGGQGYTNVTYKNLNIQNIGYGIYHWGTTGGNNVFIYNNNITGTTPLFMQTWTKDSIIENNTFIGNIYFFCVTNSNFTNNIFNSTSGTTITLYSGFGDLTQNQNIFTDGIIDGSGTYDISQNDGSYNTNNTFLNVTHDSSKLQVVTDGTTNLFIFKWYLDVYVNDTLGNPIFEATVDIYNVSDILESQQTTNSSGNIPTTAIIDYVYGGDGSVSYTYHNNHTINASATGYQDNSSNLNITSSTSIFLTLGGFPPNLEIISLTPPTTPNPTEYTTTATYTLFNVTYSNLSLVNDSSAVCIFTKTGESTRTSSSCSKTQINQSNVTSCYQESANTSNQTGIDGSCGIIYNGSYYVANSWTNAGNFYDGNWSSYAVGVTAPYAYIYINYTKPTGANQTTTKWQTYDGHYVQRNLTININCWSLQPLRLRAEHWDPGGMYYPSWQCYNGSAWVKLGDYGGGDNNNGRLFYEEAMIWNVVGEDIQLNQYNCTNDMQYYDAPGVWDINCSVYTTDESDYAENTTETFTYGSLTAMQLNTTEISFGNLAPGTTNQPASGPSQLINTGNTNFTQVNITAHQLEGVTNNSYIIPANKFKANNTNNPGIELIESTQVTIPDATLPRGALPTSTSYIYYHLDVPNIPAQVYKTNATNQWLIEVN